MKVINKKFSFNPFKEILILKAEELETAYTGSLFGKRKHWIKEGKKIEYSAKKGHYNIGDEILLKDIIYKLDISALNWDWDY